MHTHATYMFTSKAYEEDREWLRTNEDDLLRLFVIEVSIEDFRPTDSAIYGSGASTLAPVILAGDP